MNKTTKILLCVLAISLTQLLSANDLCTSAWKEYHGSNYSKSRKLFNQILTDKQSTESEKLQAKLGLAMIVHYQMPGSDPQAAIPKYKAIIESLDKNHKLIPNLYILIGNANVKLKKYDEARKNFEYVKDNYP